MTNSRGINKNTFRQGLNTDMHPLDTSKEVMTDNSNATLITSEGDEFILQNMKGSELKAVITPGFEPLAVKVFNNVAYIISRNETNPTEGEIGTYPSPDWAELNKQIPIVKDLIVMQAGEHTNPVEGINFFPTSLNISVWARKSFVGYFPYDYTLGPCPICEYRLWWNDGVPIPGNSNIATSRIGPMSEVGNLTGYSTVMEATTVNSSQSIFNMAISSAEVRVPSSGAGTCDCNVNIIPGNWNPSSLTTHPLLSPSETFVSHTIIDIIGFGLYQVGNVDIDFTNSNMEGTLEALQSNGIINENDVTGFTGVNGLIIDANTGIVKLKVFRTGDNPQIRIITNTAQTVNVNISVVGWAPAGEEIEYVKPYDMATTGLDNQQLAAATITLYHSANYPIPEIVAPDIKYKIISSPPGVIPSTYQDISLAPGEEIVLPIAGLTITSTFDLYIQYPGLGFAGQLYNYELYITYESAQGKILVDMLDQYAPLHNFYDYDGVYYDSSVIPNPPGNPPSNSDLDEEGYYVAPLRSDLFNFSELDFVDLELQPSYDRSINIIYTDGKNKPKLINSRFIVEPGEKQATIANRKGVRDTNIYSNEKWGNTDLILSSETIARVDFKGLESGGNMLAGGYRFYFIYANSDLQTSGVFAESRLVQITKGSGYTAMGGKPDERLGKTVYFQLSNMDTKFLYVKVFYARDIGEFGAGNFVLTEIANLYPIDENGSIDLRVTGYELIAERPQNFLETSFTDITTAETLTTIQGSLALGNIVSGLEHLDYLRNICAAITINEEDLPMSTLDADNAAKSKSYRRMPYVDPDNVYRNLGYWAGETYEIGIVFKMSGSNLLSPVIPIRGIDNFAGNAVYQGSGVYDPPGFIDPANDPTNTRENTNGVYRTREAKVIIDGDSLAPDSPNITFLKINVATLAADAFLHTISDGFFIVRKQRSKDCQYEGILARAMAVPLSTPVGNLNTLKPNGNTGGLGSMSINNGAYLVADPLVDRVDAPAKYVPWMGTVGNVTDPQAGSTTAKPKYNNYVWFSNKPATDANVKYSHFSFYCPEIVTRSTEVASFFSNTSRGLRYAANRFQFNGANNSIGGAFRTKKPSLWQSSYKSGLSGEYSYVGMQDYTLFTPKWRYITAGQETITPESFTAIVEGIQYNRTNITSLGWKNEPAGTEVDATASGRFYHRFDDYVGMIIEEGDSGDLWDRLQHSMSDSGVILDALAGNYTIAKDTFYDRMEAGLVSAGVVCRVYATTDGYLKQGIPWQAKYQTTSSTGYFAITDRYDWDRAGTLPGSELRMFDGDCYIGELHKRLNYKLGIVEDPAATDPNIYGDQAAALEPAGMVASIMSCSSTNFAIRSEEFKSASELVVFGTDREFYPAYSLSEIRNNKQLDSKLYYDGYNLELGAMLNARQTIELPAIVDSYPYRVLLSAPADLTSFTNGYRNFSGLNFRDYDSAFGQITKIISLQSMLFVVWEHGIGKVFTSEKTMVTDEDGGVYVDQASRLHPQAKIISNKYGSSDQYSIIASADTVYGIDWTHNKIWALDAQGTFNIVSDFKVERVLENFKNYFNNNNILPKFFAGYDSYKRNIFFNYSGLNNNDHIPVGSLYYNEMLQIWVSKLTFYPYFIFNLRENWYSFNFKAGNTPELSQIWKHNSDNVPFCNFYGEQHPFEYEFILVDNPSLQKILNNLKIISTEEYPLYVTYSIIDKHDYETNNIREVSFVDRLIKRFKVITAQTLPVIASSAFILFDTDPGILAGEHIVVDGGTKYEVQDIIEYLDDFYVYVTYIDPITGEVVGSVSQAYIGGEQVVINNGIIRENILYKEDHFYIVVGNKFIVATQTGLIATQPDELPSTPLPPPSSPSVAVNTSGVTLPNIAGYSNIDPRSLLNSGQLAGIHWGVGSPTAPIVHGTTGSTGPNITPGTPTRIIGQVQLSAPRDKYIRIKIRYKGDKQVFIQAVESMFTYSFS